MDIKSSKVQLLVNAMVPNLNPMVIWCWVNPLLKRARFRIILTPCCGMSAYSISDILQ